MNSFSCFWQKHLATIVKTILYLFRSAVWGNWFCMKSWHCHVFYRRFSKFLHVLGFWRNCFRRLLKTWFFVPSGAFWRNCSFLKNSTFYDDFHFIVRSTVGLLAINSRHSSVKTVFYVSRETFWREITWTESLMYSFYWTCSGTSSRLLADVFF